MKCLLSACFLFLFLLLTSCNENDESTHDDFTSDNFLIESIDAIAYDQDIEDLVADGISINNSLNKTEPATAKNSNDWFKDRYGKCLTITNDTINNRKTIFFNPDCQGRRWQSRTGTIVITYSDNKDSVGSFRQTTYDDFYMNGVKIEGVKRTEITTLDDLGNKTTLSTLENGKMIYEDGTFSTKAKAFTRYTVKEDGLRQYSILNGNSSGVSSDGVSYSMTITTPIKFVYNCFSSNRYRGRGKIPVEGIKTLTKGSDITTINYGDGTCDLEATVTTNGVTEVVDLRSLKRGSKFRRF